MDRSGRNGLLPRDPRHFSPLLGDVESPLRPERPEMIMRYLGIAGKR